MFIVRRIVGESMSPGLLPGDVVVGWSKNIHVGDIVIAKQKGREVIKRVAAIKGERVELHGDNTEKSSDSRRYGPVEHRDILAVMKVVLPKATTPAALHARWQYILSYALASIFTLLALVQLFRIDTLIPIFDRAVPGSYDIATLLLATLLMFTVFAVPHLLRLPLSPLFRLMNAGASVLVPLSWIWIAIWNFGNGIEIGLLGEFVPLEADAATLAALLVWLSASLVLLKVSEKAGALGVVRR